MFLYNTVVEDVADPQEVTYDAPVERTDNLLNALHDLATYVGQEMWTSDQYGDYSLRGDAYRVLVEQLDEDGEIVKVLTALVKRGDEEDTFTYVHPAPREDD